MENIKSFLTRIRESDKSTPRHIQILVSIGIAMAGFALGVLQKWLDSGAVNELPVILQRIDIGNYFGRFAIWILLGTVISQNADKGSNQYIFVFHLHGCRILLVLPLCIGIPAKDIYDGMGHILFGFTDTGIYLLVCERRWNHCCPDISLYPGSVILTGIFDHAGILCDSPAGGYNMAGRRHHFDQETERNDT